MQYSVTSCREHEAAIVHSARTASESDNKMDDEMSDKEILGCKQTRVTSVQKVCKHRMKCDMKLRNMVSLLRCNAMQFSRLATRNSGNGN